jgi:hypothetical protein
MGRGHHIETQLNIIIMNNEDNKNDNDDVYAPLPGGFNEDGQRQTTAVKNIMAQRVAKAIGQRYPCHFCASSNNDKVD